MLFGLIAFAIYYIYNGKEENETEDTNIISESNVEEITNIRLVIANLDNLNPIVSKNQNVQDILKLVYEPLLNVTEDYKLESSLLTEWSKAETKAYLIKIREGVKWHNGTDFIAQDVKYTIDTIKALGDNSIYYSNVRNIENVEIVGNNILRITLYEEEPFFEYNLTFPIISSTFFSGEDLNISSKSNIPMGTGMYKLQSVDITSSLELKINPNWWDIEERKQAKAR